MKTARQVDVLSRAARRARDCESSDSDLLARFAAGDQAAFEPLVHRHAGMVLGVCRRVLPTLQDAEDACQATFLILARKADGHWQPSVANWLYTTARRVADRARRTAVRRTQRECRSAVPESTTPADPLTAWELLAALDAELERLPAHYREPLVLCYLEGQTRDEAAARLGVPLGTVKTRLERGRRRLEAALTRRGLGLGCGLLAAAVVKPAGASSTRLIDSILSTASGSPSAAVAELARVTPMGHSYRVMLAAVAGIAAVVGLGYGWAASGPGSTAGETAGPIGQTAIPHEPPAGESEDKKFRDDVNTSREKAIKFLRKYQQPHGSWRAQNQNMALDNMEGGVTALVVLGLLEAGVSVDDLIVAIGANALLPSERKRTYVVSLQTQVLARLDAKKYADIIQWNADWLIKHKIGLAKDGELQGWSYPFGTDGVHADGSNTHFAVVGLHAAVQAGAKVDTKIWESIRDHYVRTRSDRGWKYSNVIQLKDSPTYSMTAAALAGLLIADYHVKPSEPSKDAFARGMAALPSLKGKPISIAYNWMVTAELGRLLKADVFRAGDQEVHWYRDGATQLVKDQNPDGSWAIGKSPIDSDPVLATAFALYFLGPERK